MEKYALWIPSWYPTSVSPYDGDFIQRHAKAVSEYEKIVVVFVKKDEEGIVTKNKWEAKKTADNLTEIIFYYHPYTTGIKIIDKFISFYCYYSSFLKTINKVIKELGSPSLIHTHVIKKTAWLSLKLKKKFNVPLVISEHWSGFLPEMSDGYKNNNFIYKRYWNKAFNAADKITVVSAVLGKGIQKHFNIQNFEVLPNVVDTSIFFPEEKIKNISINFLHISGGGIEKNIDQMLAAFAIVKNKGYQFILHLIVPDKNNIEATVSRLNLEDNILFHDEVPQKKLANIMQQSDALVLYSHYETFGCVVIEANAIGIPAIVSDLPVFKEYCIANKTAIFAEKDHPERLADAFIFFIENQALFNKNEIATRTQELFSYQRVGNQFHFLYDALLLSQNAVKDPNSLQ